MAHQLLHQFDRDPNLFKAQPSGDLKDFAIEVVGMAKAKINTILDALLIIEI
jgi:hypothetical protein